MSDTPTKTREVHIIRVKARENGTVGLAHVIAQSVRAGKVVVLQGVGAAAVSLAVKGVASAGQTLAFDRIALSCSISFQDGKPSAGFTDPVSIIVIHVESKELL